MQQYRTVGLLVFMFMFTGTFQVFGNGFALYENSSRASAFSSAFVAQADDPSAVFFNPAGVTQLEGTQAMLGFNTYTADYVIAFKDGEEESLMDRTWVIPYLYATHQFNDTAWLGFGVFAPFGLGNEYRQEWRGRYNIYNSLITCIEFNPNLILKASETTSVSIGVSVQRVAVKAESKIKPKELVVQGIRQIGLDEENAEKLYQYQYARDFDSLPDIDQSASLDNTLWRFNLGLRYQPTDKLSFGLAYRSWADHNLTGTVAYQNVPDTPSLSLTPMVYNSRIQSKLKLPDVWAGGVAYRPLENLVLEFDVVRTRWSRYSSLSYEFGNQLGVVTQEKNWKNAYTYRFGVEYWVTEQWAARLGYLFDESPVPDSTIDYVLPDNDRHMVTVGAGFKHQRFSVDAHYAAIILLDRDIHKNQSVFLYEDAQVKDGLTHQVGMNLSYYF